MILKRIKIRKFERGLRFEDREFVGVMQPGVHWLFDPFGRVRVDVVSVRAPWLEHSKLDVIVKSDALGDEVRVIDLGDWQRAIVWIDGRFARIAGPGLAVLWTAFRDVEIEIFDAREPRFEHESLEVILKSGEAEAWINQYFVEPGHVGLYFRDGELQATLRPGRHAFWAFAGKVRLEIVDVRESVLDISGQEIMTADKVSLRLNAVVAFRVIDAVKAVTEIGDRNQALYREAQLALRAVIGTRELDDLLARKDEMAGELEGILKARVDKLGLDVVSLGIRDIVLPGEMKVLLNRVTEAQKAAEAALITRREEVAAARSQVNTARLLDANPTLMRLRELEILEKLFDKANLQVLLGEKGLADRVMNLL